MLAEMIALQLKLQTEKMKDGDPRNLTGDARADFIRSNAYALEDEVHEATAECSWKPWAKADFVNRDAFINEMVDAWHFFMNMMLAVSPGHTPEQLAEEFFGKYVAKNQVNAQRQDDQYTGIKCPQCHREIEAGNRTNSFPQDLISCPCGKVYSVPKGS